MNFETSYLTSFSLLVNSEYSMQLNASRIKVLQAQDDLVNKMKDDAGKELLRVSHNHHEYKNLLKDLIVQVWTNAAYTNSMFFFLQISARQYLKLLNKWHLWILMHDLILSQWRQTIAHYAVCRLCLDLVGLNRCQMFNRNYCTLLPIIVKTSISLLVWSNAGLAPFERACCIAPLPQGRSPSCGICTAFSKAWVCIKSRCPWTRDICWPWCVPATCPKPSWCSWPVLVMFAMQLVICLETGVLFNYSLDSWLSISAAGWHATIELCMSVHGIISG